jgi:hypothetical protein
MGARKEQGGIFGGGDDTALSLRRIWSNMRNRCYNPNATQYKWYGGRGIQVCDEWGTFDRFESDVLRLIGPRPSTNYTLDRIDNNGNYEPSNIRWATQSEQVRNSSTVRLITIDGETKCLQAWADDSGVSPSTISKRIELGWLKRNLLLPTGTLREGVRGERNPAAKLDAATVEIIKGRLAHGEKGRYIAREFQVAETTISYIKRGRTWR